MQKILKIDASIYTGDLCRCLQQANNMIMHVAIDYRRICVLYVAINKIFHSIYNKRVVLGE